MSVFIIMSTIIFLYLAVSWSRKSWLNISIKVFLWMMTFYGCYLILNNQLFG